MRRLLWSEDNGYECQFYVSSRDELWLVSGELEWVGDSPCRSYWNPHQSSLEVADIHNADKEVQRVIRRIEASEMTE